MKPRFSPFLCIVLLLSGCIGSSHFTEVRHDLDDQLQGVRFKRQVGVQVGPLTMGLTRFILSFMDDPETDEARALLRAVQVAHVRVYEIVGRLRDQEVRTPRALRQMQDHGWNMLVKVRDDESNVWVMSRDRLGDVRDLYLVVMDDENLVMARVKGNFTTMVEKAMQMSEEDRYKSFMPFSKTLQDEAKEDS